MGLWRRITNTFSRERLQREIADELAFHLEQKEGAARESGIPAEPARLAAQRRFGNLRLATEKTADCDVVRWLENLLRDAPLALGIGANTAVFTVMKLIVMDALPVKQPQQLVVLHDRGPEFSSYGFHMG